MKKIVQILQFTVGLSLLIGGVAALAPIAAELVADPVPMASQEPGQAAAVVPSPAAFGHAIPDTHPAGMPLTEVHALPAQGSSTAETAPGPARPTQPPARMPVAFPGVGGNGPALGATYRSTIDIPPPPLLNAEGPPPVAPGWATRGVRQPDPAAAVPSLPATYTVRDGDDLTTLAIRLYGHPGAAAAILAANRDHITDPAILPIGIRLRLPPPWTMTGGRTMTGQPAIEPGPGGNRTPAPPRAAATPTSASRAWMAPGIPADRP